MNAHRGDRAGQPFDLGRLPTAHTIPGVLLPPRKVSFDWTAGRIVVPRLQLNLDLAPIPKLKSFHRGYRVAPQWVRFWKWRCAEVRISGAARPAIAGRYGPRAYLEEVVRQLTDWKALRLRTPIPSSNGFRRTDYILSPSGPGRRHWRARLRGRGVVESLGGGLRSNGLAKPVGE